MQTFFYRLFINKTPCDKADLRAGPQLCRLGGPIAAGNLNKQHHQVARLEMNVRSYPGHLQPDPAIPLLSSSNLTSRVGPQPLLGKSESKTVKEIFSGSEAYPGKA